MTIGQDGFDAPLREWFQRLATFIAAIQRDGISDEECGALDHEFAAYSRSLLEQPVASWLDVVLKVVVAQHWNSPGLVASPSYPDWVISGMEASRGMDDLSLAYSVRGVLAMGRIAYPAVLSSIERATRELP